MSGNMLREEKSLYLQQHAENPVNWYPYGAQALEKAKAEGKLIFVSIGYSSCHWCHVMAHESFEDEATAKMLNENFISIKVDREEYPDLDHFYQTACSLISGRGGWPLNVFLTPEGKPFFAGTYFPTENFHQIIRHVTDLQKNNPADLKANADKLVAEISKPATPEKKIEFQGHFPAPAAIINALKNFADTTNGGYGKAPKFPHFPFYEWASEQILEGMIPQEQGQHIVETVERMLMGGMYDHVKGGIHRYSTDDKFLVPHFEKMLYDQAGLLKVLARMGQFYPAPVVFDGILQTIDYLRTEMVSDDGFFFSAQDADSEGTEGLYFTFSKEEFVASFDDAPEKQKEKLNHYLEMFNITDKGNFEHGLNVISLNPTMKPEFYMQDGWQEVRDIRRRLLEQRKLRMPPATDRKGLSSWNYMTISALADVVQYCPIDVIQGAAYKLIEATVEGCLKQFISNRDGRHAIRHSNTLENQGLYLEDYVNFSEAQLRLYEITGNETFKTNAIESAEFVLKNFVKEKRVYSTALEANTVGIENLVAPLYDQSYRSAHATLVLLLNRLSVFKPEFSPLKALENEYSMLPQYILVNPLGHGEGLRAMTYPLEIHRKVEVPRAWLQRPEFLEIRSHFFSRFVMDYHSRNEDEYQICTASACEVTGKGFEKFKEIFSAKEQNA